MTLSYPPAPHSDAIETLAGVSFPDPYRPLEHGDAPDVEAWQTAEASLADEYVAAIPDIEVLRARVSRYAVSRFGSIPRFAGGRWFRTSYSDGATQSHVVVATDPTGNGDILFDPADHPTEDGLTPFLSWLSPSPDGRLLAVGLCGDGSESNTIRVVDTDSGKVLDDRPAQLLMDNWMGGAQWLGDSSGFFYVALEGPKEEVKLRVFRHDIGQPARTTPEKVPLPGRGAEYVGVLVSRDGRWAVVHLDLMRPKPIALLDLTDPSATWQPFMSEAVDATVAGYVIGDEFVALTDLFAPRGRVVGIPLAGPRPDDPATWRVIVPETDAALRTMTPVGGGAVSLRVCRHLRTGADRGPHRGGARRGAAAGPGRPGRGTVPVHDARAAGSPRRVCLRLLLTHRVVGDLPPPAGRLRHRDTE